jgi:hypothetical protein
MPQIRLVTDAGPTSPLPQSSTGLANRPKPTPASLDLDAANPQLHTIRASRLDLGCRHPGLTTGRAAKHRTLSPPSSTERRAHQLGLTTHECRAHRQGPTVHECQDHRWSPPRRVHLPELHASAEPAAWSPTCMSTETIAAHEAEARCWSPLCTSAEQRTAEARQGPGRGVHACGRVHRWSLVPRARPSCGVGRRPDLALPPNLTANP